jgi:hypothetical protein
MSNDLNSAAASVVIADAVTGSTKSPQFSVTPSPIVKGAIAVLRDELGLKNIVETCDALVGALLGFLPYEEDGESVEDAATRIGLALAGLASAKEAGESVESLRKLRKLEDDIRKADEAKRKNEEARAALRAKLGK